MPSDRDLLANAASQSGANGTGVGHEEAKAA
jgi:hypothetical protein